VYNFNIIPKSLLTTYNDNACHVYFNDVKPPTPTTICNDTWTKINSYAENLNWYDLFRQTYPDDGLLKADSNPEKRLKSVMINGEEKIYKSGFT
jgi:hypothetical protein